MKSFILAVFVLLAAPLYGQKSIKMEKGSMADILAMAKEENKPVMVDVYADWCGPCKMMEKRVFTKKKIANFYNNNFVNYKLDADSREGNAICNELRIQSIPAFIFYTPDGRIITSTEGVLSPADFLALGEKMLKKSKKKKK